MSLAMSSRFDVGHRTSRVVGNVTDKIASNYSSTTVVTAVMTVLPVMSELPVMSVLPVM